METKLLFTINNKYIFVLDLLNICLLYNIRVNISVHNVYFFFPENGIFQPSSYDFESKTIGWK